MNNELFEALELLERQKGIPKEYMIERVEAALINAVKRDQGGEANVKVVIDPEKRDMKIYRQYDIVEEVEEGKSVTQMTLEEARKYNKHYKLGGVAEIEIKSKNLRRLGANAGKQVIIQGIREAERGMMIKEYEDKKESIITATVLRIDEETGNAMLDTGTSVATLLKNEQIPGEEYKENDKIKVFVTEVRKEQAKGPLVTLSRTHPGLVRRLFELEVPEVSSGIVEIKNVIREAGSRTKISVISNDSNVDPVGACIGNRSMRINNILSELNGEKIDIIKYSEVPEEYVAAALSPAVINSARIEEEHVCRVYVNEDQLSLAIGKEGQNARLAAKLTGYKIDIKVGM